MGAVENLESSEGFPNGVGIVESSDDFKGAVGDLWEDASLRASFPQVSHSTVTVSASTGLPMSRGAEWLGELRMSNLALAERNMSMVLRHFFLAFSVATYL